MNVANKMLASFLKVLKMDAQEELCGANDSSLWGLLFFFISSRATIRIFWFSTSSDNISTLSVNLWTVWKKIVTSAKI